MAGPAASLPTSPAGRLLLWLAAALVLAFLVLPLLVIVPLSFTSGTILTLPIPGFSLRWYADLRRFGSSPHGGFGLGFDRLLAYLTGAASVREVVAFPRYWGRAEC